jgi:hypothetical protein
MNYHEDYVASMVDFQTKAKGLRLGYVPGVIRHYYHGSKKNRQYTERWMVLIDHQFSPARHLTSDPSGILIPTEEMSQEFIGDIYRYFQERKEDE